MDRKKVINSIRQEFDQKLRDGMNITATEVNERMNGSNGVMSNKLSDPMAKHVRESFSQNLHDAIGVIERRRLFDLGVRAFKEGIPRKPRIKFYSNGAPVDFSETLKIIMWCKTIGVNPWLNIINP